MKYIYGVESKEELTKYQELVNELWPRLDNYIHFLKDEYKVVELPRTIVWTSLETATKLICDIPIPAYTNDYRVVMTPDLDAWKNIYLKQLDNIKVNDSNKELINNIKDYYQNHLSNNHVLQILGHELAHHSELFIEDFNNELSNGIWFEEGMVEYISRSYFLTKDEFELEAYYNQQLVNLLKYKYGNHSLEEFGTSTYKGDYASIFFEYWRSFFTVKQIIEAYNNDIHAVIDSYHKWNESNDKKTLLEWFVMK